MHNQTLNRIYTPKSVLSKPGTENRERNTERKKGRKKKEKSIALIFQPWNFCNWFSDSPRWDQRIIFPAPIHNFNKLASFFGSSSITTILNKKKKTKTIIVDKLKTLRNSAWEIRKLVCCDLFSNGYLTEWWYNGGLALYHWVQSAWVAILTQKVLYS